MDDSLEASTEGELFLSFHPESRQFKVDNEQNPVDDAVELGQACDGTNAANMTHAQVLTQPNVYAWMRNNPESVIPLSVHGNQVYEAIVLDRLSKLEEKRNREAEEAKRRRQEQEAAQLLPDLSDEEANEDIKRQLAEAKKAADEAKQDSH